jgi:hypothetical protein
LEELGGRLGSNPLVGFIALTLVALEIYRAHYAAILIDEGRAISRALSS